MTPHELETTSRAFFAAMNAGDFDALVATMADDAVSYEPVGTPPNTGRAELRAFYEQMAAAFATMEITVERVVAVADATAVAWSGRGVLHNGDALTFEGIDVHEFDDAGRIRTLKGYFDPAPMMAALGH